MKSYASLVLVLALTGAAAQQAAAADGSVKQIHPGEAVSLNPQPEPPGITAANSAALNNIRKAGGETVGFNPQPDPPGDFKPQVKQMKRAASAPGQASGK